MGRSCCPNCNLGTWRSQILLFRPAQEESVTITSCRAWIRTGNLLGKVGFGVGCSGRDWDCLVPSLQRLLEPEPAWNIQPQICRDSSDPKTPVRTGSVFIRAAVNEFGVPQGFQSYPGWKSRSSQKIPEEPRTEKFQRT